MPNSLSIKKSLPCHRTGFGFDSHAYSETGGLVLGGVTFPNMPALRGHSDGDALIHAVIDALLGAASLGDIGEMFPDTSKKLKGVSSVLLLSNTLSRIKKAGWVPTHVDVVVLANAPRLSPHKARLEQSLARALKMTTSFVNVKAKTQEGLNWFIPPGGVAVWAVATIQRDREGRPQ